MDSRLENNQLLVIELDDDDDFQEPAIMNGESMLNPNIKNEYHLEEDEMIESKINLKSIDPTMYLNSNVDPILNQTWMNSLPNDHASSTHEINASLSANSLSEQISINQEKIINEQITDNNGKVKTRKIEASITVEQTSKINGESLVNENHTNVEQSTDKPLDYTDFRQPKIIKIPETGQSKIKTIKVFPPIDPSIDGNRSPTVKSLKVDIKSTLKSFKDHPISIKSVNRPSLVSKNDTPKKAESITKQSVDNKIRMCIREGCVRRAIKSDNWDNEYCSCECLIKHCKAMFNSWLADRIALKTKK